LLLVVAAADLVGTQLVTAAVVAVVAVDSLKAI